MAAALTQDKYTKFAPAEVGKLLRDLAAYNNVIKKKAEKLSSENRDFRNLLANKEAQEEFQQRT